MSRNPDLTLFIHTRVASVTVVKFDTVRVEDAEFGKI